MRRALAPIVLLALAATPAWAASQAASLDVRIMGNGYDESGPNKHDDVIALGQTITIVLEIRGAMVGQPAALPQVSGLTFNGSGSDPFGKPPTLNYFVTASRLGDVTIPAFDVRTKDGQNLRAGPILLHVVKQAR